MKKSAFIMLMGALLALIALPSFASDMETRTSSKLSLVIDSNENAINLQNALDAYADENAARIKYAAYSSRAENEGYHQIAMLFRAISVSNGVHARNHKKILKKAGFSVERVKPDFKVKTTRENLKDAIAIESNQVNKLYPNFIICANQAGQKDCYKCMCYAYLVSKKHKAHFEKALAALDNGNAANLSDLYFVCPDCGNTYGNKIQESCQFCDVSHWKYIQITE